MNMHTLPAIPSFAALAKRGLSCRCPACGQGRLFRGYLTPVDRCASCGEHLRDLRADDGPAWLTIIVTGHLLAPVLLGIVPRSPWPLWLSLMVWLSIALAVMLLLLPRMKGIFIALVWRHQLPASRRVAGRSLSDQRSSVEGTPPG